MCNVYMTDFAHKNGYMYYTQYSISQKLIEKHSKWLRHEAG